MVLIISLRIHKTKMHVRMPLEISQLLPPFQEDFLYLDFLNKVVVGNPNNKIIHMSLEKLSLYIYIY